MTKNQMIRSWLSPSTCKEPVLQRKLRRVQKDVIEQIYRNPMSNNKRREIFYSVLDNLTYSMVRIIDLVEEK